MDIRIEMPLGAAPLANRNRGVFSDPAYIELDAENGVLRAGIGERPGAFEFHATYIKKEALERLMREEMLPLARRMLAGDTGAHEELRRLCGQTHAKECFSSIAGCKESVWHMKFKDESVWPFNFSLRDMAYRACQLVWDRNRILCQPYFTALETEENQLFFMEDALLDRLTVALRTGELKPTDLSVMQKIALQTHRPDTYGSRFWGEESWDAGYEPLTCREFFPFLLMNFWEYRCGPGMSDPFANATRRALERAANLNIRISDPENIHGMLLDGTCEWLEDNVRAGRAWDELCAELPWGVFKAVKEAFPERITALLTEEESFSVTP